MNRCMFVYLSSWKLRKHHELIEYWVFIVHGNGLGGISFRDQVHQPLAIHSGCASSMNRSYDQAIQTMVSLSNVGIAIINHQSLMVYTTHLWWLGGWFMTLLYQHYSNSSRVRQQADFGRCFGSFKSWSFPESMAWGARLYLTRDDIPFGKLTYWTRPIDSWYMLIYLLRMVMFHDYIWKRLPEGTYFWHLFFIGAPALCQSTKDVHSRSVSRRQSSHQKSYISAHTQYRMPFNCLVISRIFCVCPGPRESILFNIEGIHDFNVNGLA